MKTTYKVTNTYGIKGGSSHRTPEAACKAAKKREGEGWVVVDSDGNQWDYYAGEAYITRSKND